MMTLLKSLKITAAAASLGILAGCAALEGYQYGDFTKEVKQRQAEYCLETDPGERAFRVGALRAIGAPIPASGACTDILALLTPQDIVELDIDVEQAEADQRRFEEMYGEGFDEQ